MSNCWTEIKYIILVIVASIILFFGISVLTKSCSETAFENAYNNGTCQCGGHFEFSNVSNSKYYTYKHYKCDECDKIISVIVDY